MLNSLLTRCFSMSMSLTRAYTHNTMWRCTADTLTCSTVYSLAASACQSHWPEPTHTTQCDSVLQTRWHAQQSTHSLLQHVKVTDQSLHTQHNVILYRQTCWWFALAVTKLLFNQCQSLTSYQPQPSLGHWTSISNHTHYLATKRWLLNYLIKLIGHTLSRRSRVCFSSCVWWSTSWPKSTSTISSRMFSILARTLSMLMRKLSLVSSQLLMVDRLSSAS